MEREHLISLHRPLVEFALDKHSKVHSDRLKPSDGVNLIDAVDAG